MRESATLTLMRAAHRVGLALRHALGAVEAALLVADAVFLGARLVGRNSVAAVERHENLHHVVSKLIEPVLGSVEVGRAVGAVSIALRLAAVAGAVAVVVDDQCVHQLHELGCPRLGCGP